MKAKVSDAGAPPGQDTATLAKLHRYLCYMVRQIHLLACHEGLRLFYTIGSKLASFICFGHCG